MCQDSFDGVFDVLEKLAGNDEIEMVSVVTVSGRVYAVNAAAFVEDNQPVRDHGKRLRGDVLTRF